MPYKITWIDKQARVLNIQLEEPLLDPELSGLKQELQPVIDIPQPLFALLNLHNINPMELFTRFSTNLDGLPFPNFKQHFERSRLAIIGGGPTLASLLTLANQISGQTELIRTFKDENAAIKWLRGEE